VVKIRQQLDGELKGRGAARKYPNFASGLVSIVRTEGLMGLYKGILPSVLRELSYSGVRMGLYEPFKELLGATDRANTPLSVKVAAGAMSGTVGASFANPCDLIKIRCQAYQGPGSLGVIDAVKHVVRHEGGVPGLWQGVLPSVQRAALLTATQVPAYDEIKHQCLRRGLASEGLLLHFAASSLAGFLTAMVTNPVDIVKTRMMEQRAAAASSGTAPRYSGALDCLLSTVRNEGPAALWKGAMASWARIGPHTTVSLMVFEGLRSAIGAEAL